ncbi:hypothetical protein SAY86_007883 [Trapa natans]|uniref:FMR1-interacting protein 1 conserved domain-containing protein n=1 Tax=Trapa natans TaxID=22666 RepID=A0AAN7LFW3_TRANT|nr:hypothetical protein SAY86_007883 [Trapa natans]
MLQQLIFALIKQRQLLESLLLQAINFREIVMVKLEEITLNFRNFQTWEFTMNCGNERNVVSIRRKMETADLVVLVDLEEKIRAREIQFGISSSFGKIDEWWYSNWRESMTYTKQEIKQWREERRKIHPSNSRASKQLKEILEKHRLGS